MKYPIIFKRKRTGSIILNAVLIAVSIAMLIYGTLEGESIGLYIRPGRLVRLGRLIRPACIKTNLPRRAAALACRIDSGSASQLRLIEARAVHRLC